MRKQIAWILVLLLLTGCGAAAEPEVSMSTTVPATVPATAAPETTEATEPTEPEAFSRFRLKKEIRHGTDGGIVSATEYFYDDQGRLYREEYSDASGNPTGSREYVLGDGYREYTVKIFTEIRERMYLDEMGRTTKMEIYQNDELDITAVFDTEGRIVQAIEKTGVTVCEYDEKGNLTVAWQGPDLDSLEKIEENTYTYLYDDQGRITRVTGPKYHTDYTYGQNQVTETIIYDQRSGNNPQGTVRTTVITYDDYGNVIREETVGGEVTEYTYIAMELPG